MDAPMKRFMRPGIVSFKAFPIELGTGPILESLEKICADSFFSAIEVGWMKDPQVRDEARRLLEQSHLEVCYGAQPAMFSQKLNINALDPEARRRALNQMKNCIREAAHLGAKWVRVFSGKDPGPERRDEARTVLVDSLLQLCEFAQGHNNPGLTLKIFDRAVDKEFLVGPYQEALEVVRAVRRSFPSFGLLVDLSHFCLLEEDPAVVIPALRPYLVHVHIGNAYIRSRTHVAYGDLQPRFGFPDSEVTVDDVRAFFRLLVDQGFFNPADRPVCSAEVRPLAAGERSELIIANTKRVMEEAWALA